MESLADIGLTIMKRFKLLQDAELKPVDNQPQEWPKHLFLAQFDRFELWAVNLGVFVMGHGSLDYRIRDSESMKESISKMMQNLNRSLDEVLAYLDGTIEQGDEDSDTDSDSEMESDMDLLLDSVRDPIDRLYKMAIWIRNPATRMPSSKARYFQQIDEETNVDLFKSFEDFDYDHISSLFLEYEKNKALQKSSTVQYNDTDGDFNKFMVEDDMWEPIRNVLTLNRMKISNGDESYLVRRIARANGLRRQQFAYWRKHKNKLREHATIAVEIPTHKIPTASHIIPNEVEKLKAPLSVTTATQLRLLHGAGTEVLQRENIMDFAVSEYAPSEWNPSKDVVSFPLPPKASVSDGFFECPYCHTICPASVLSEKAWRAHLIRDLRPYICTFEHCANSDQLYDNRDDWIQHEISTHQNVFRCPKHEEQAFSTLAAYKEHTSTYHKEDAMPWNLAKSTTTNIHRSCPICSIDLGTMQKLQSHIALHLERFAMFALPRCTDEDNVEGSGGQSVGARVDSNRSFNEDFDTGSNATDESSDNTPELKSWLSGIKAKRLQMERQNLESILQPHKGGPIDKEMQTLRAWMKNVKTWSPSNAANAVLFELGKTFIAVGLIPEAIETLEHLKLFQIGRLDADDPALLATIQQLAIAYQVSGALQVINEHLGPGADLQTEPNKSKALDIFSRTEAGKRHAEIIWGPGIWKQAESDRNLQDEPEHAREASHDSPSTTTESHLEHHITRDPPDINEYASEHYFEKFRQLEADIEFRAQKDPVKFLREDLAEALGLAVDNDGNVKEAQKPADGARAMSESTATATTSGFVLPLHDPKSTDDALEPAESQGSPPPSANKNHKCPYCNKEFTHHHDLKRHLLTHNQEKPYVCTDCQMRFRHLHELKRHGKLHTSMDSFADEDEMDSGVDPAEAVTTGVVYENPEEEELRRQSLGNDQRPADGARSMSASTASVTTASLVLPLLDPEFTDDAFKPAESEPQSSLDTFDRRPLPSQQELKSYKQLPCELHWFGGCDEKFDLRDGVGWTDHVETQHLRLIFPSQSRCWFCDEVFRARPDDSERQLGAQLCFAKRMRHIARHYEQGEDTNNIRPDFDLLNHLRRNGLISERDFQRAKRLHEDPLQLEQTPEGNRSVVEEPQRQPVSSVQSYLSKIWVKYLRDSRHLSCPVCQVDVIPPTLHGFKQHVQSSAEKHPTEEKYILDAFQKMKLASSKPQPQPASATDVIFRTRTLYAGLRVVAEVDQPDDRQNPILSDDEPSHNAIKNLGNAVTPESDSEDDISSMINYVDDEDIQSILGVEETRRYAKSVEGQSPERSNIDKAKILESDSEDKILLYPLERTTVGYVEDLDEDIQSTLGIESTRRYARSAAARSPERSLTGKTRMSEPDSGDEIASISFDRPTVDYMENDDGDDEQSIISEDSTRRNTREAAIRSHERSNPNKNTTPEPDSEDKKTSRINNPPGFHSAPAPVSRPLPSDHGRLHEDRGPRAGHEEKDIEMQEPREQKEDQLMQGEVRKSRSDATNDHITELDGSLEELDPRYRVEPSIKFQPGEVCI
ncbi:hypothetical protein V8C35DRAFT_302829 [Trichoderma chlorosporum]